MPFFCVNAPAQVQETENGQRSRCRPNQSHHQEMKELVIALPALAGITLLSGCAYDYYPYYYGHYAYGYAYGPYYYHPAFVHSRLGWSGWDCVRNFNTLYCGRV
jgi:hypothetical protein